LDICKGVRPEINESEAPKSYIDLMKKCWDLNPKNRPNVAKLLISFWSISVSNSEIEKAENYRNLHLSSSKGDRQITHPQHLDYLILLQKIFQNILIIILNVLTV